MKKLIIFIIIIIIFPICPLSVSADTAYDELYRSSGADSLEDYSGNFAQKYDISVESPENILNVTPENFFNEIKDIVKNQIQSPFEMFVKMLAVIILSVMLDGIGGSISQNSLKKVFGTICVLICVNIIFQPLSECFSVVSAAINGCSLFMNVFIPIFAGISAVSGNALSISAYTLTIIGVSSFAIQLSNLILMPMLSMCVAISASDAVCTSLKLGEITKALKKTVNIILGFFMTAFTGLLTIQSVIGKAAEGVTAKTAKFLMSNSVPVVGNAVSDAYTTVRASLGLLKGGTGTFGIVTLCSIILPAIISAALYRFFIKAGALSADILGAENLARLFHSIENIIAVVFSMSVCFAMMMIVSTAIIMASQAA